MIGMQPSYALPPLDYRNALDAAMSFVHGDRVMVRCNVPTLAEDALGRVPRRWDAGSADAGLWVEPLAASWQADLRSFAQNLGVGAALCVVVSRPLARLLPERRGWPDRPLGLQVGGVARLRRALASYGFAVAASYGFHSLAAIGLSVLSQQASRFGRPEIGDRLHFAARLRYAAGGPLAPLSTVGLLVAKRGRE
jgi:hypothetical protein